MIIILQGYDKTCAMKTRFYHSLHKCPGNVSWYCSWSKWIPSSNKQGHAPWVGHPLRYMSHIWKNVMLLHSNACSSKSVDPNPSKVYILLILRIYGTEMCKVFRNIQGAIEIIQGVTMVFSSKKWVTWLLCVFLVWLIMQFLLLYLYWGHYKLSEKPNL